MSGELRGNYKVMRNSPYKLNPTRLKIVQPMPSAGSSALMGSLADSTGGSILNHVGGTLRAPGRVLIAIPKRASLVAKDAIAWQRSFAGQLDDLVNKEAIALEQAVQAVQIKNDIMIAARNAMDDANIAAQMNITLPARTFDEMVRARGKEYSGGALYRAVLEDARADL